MPFFCFGAIMLDERNLKKRLLIPILHIFACLVSIHSEMWIQQQTSRLHQGLVSLAWFWWVLFAPEIFVSSHPAFERHMYSSDPRPDTGSLMQLESRRAIPQTSQPPSNASARILIIPQLEFGITHISFIFLFFDSKSGSCQRICRTVAILDVTILCTV